MTYIDPRIQCTCDISDCGGAVQVDTRPEPGLIEVTLVPGTGVGSGYPSVLLDPAGVAHLIAALQQTLAAQLEEVVA